MQIIKIKKLNENLGEIKSNFNGEWFDLRCSEIKQRNGFKVLNESNSIHYKKGDILLLGLGIATELPEGYEAIILPRSSTFKNYGFLLTNSQGVIDNSYRGEWSAMVYCTRNGIIEINDRFLQFRIQRQQSATIEYVDVLSETERGSGGYGSSGVK